VEQGAGLSARDENEAVQVYRWVEGMHDEGLCRWFLSGPVIKGAILADLGCSIRLSACPTGFDGEVTHALAICY
jgi:hypothetical protein